MLKVLVPVEGSPNSQRAVQHVIDEYRRHHALEIHLLNVQPRLSRHVARFVSRGNRESWHREQAEAAMADARKALEQAGVPHQLHWCLGDKAKEICRTATQLQAHHIVMGTARKNSITRMLEDSVTNRVLEDTPVPVEVVAGEAISPWERWGVPAAAMSALAMLIIGID